MQPTPEGLSGLGRSIAYLNPPVVVEGGFNGFQDELAVLRGGVAILGCPSAFLGLYRRLAYEL
jgi:hypothetical protein